MSIKRPLAAAVAPLNVEQVQAIVRIANRLGVPLYPISTGKNFGYGGPAPNLSGRCLSQPPQLTVSAPPGAEALERSACT
jgi:hypothetical protein